MSIFSFSRRRRISNIYTPPFEREIEEFLRAERAAM